MVCNIQSSMIQKEYLCGKILVVNLFNDILRRSIKFQGDRLSITLKFNGIIS